MNSLAAVSAPSDLSLAAVVQQLLEVAVPVELSPVQGGSNNRIYRVDVGDRAFALKCYPHQVGDTRDRLRVEFSALSFLKVYGIDAAPEPVALERDTGIAVYEWIEGTSVTKPGLGDVEQALAFLHRLGEVGGASEARRLPLASAACTSPAAVVAQIEARHLRLADAVTADHDLLAFLETEFVPVFKALVARAREGTAAAGIPFSDELEHRQRRLSPSDFGFHNALRRPDGRLVFIDFEYFGWDDPAKLTSDFLWHPGHRLTPDLAHAFATGAAALFEAADPDFAARHAALHPLFGLCWTLILLNEFLPVTAARRDFANPAADADAARMRQLSRARTLLCKLREGYVDCHDNG